MLSVLMVVMGFYLLVKGADVFVDGASRMATRLGIPPLVVGLTIVALGTSAPEAAISLSSSLAQADELAIANVLGSNIINVLVILGAVALVAKVPLSRAMLRMDLPLVLGSTAMLLGLCLHDGMLGRLDASLLLAVLGTYLWYVVRTARGQGGEAQGGVMQGVAGPGASSRREIVGMVAGALAIAAGAQASVVGATGLARAVGLSDRLIGLTVVALGTSLPELVTSVTAARKGQNEVALGNVVGSCMLNLLFVLGLSGLVAPVPFAASMLADGLVAMGAVALVWVLCVRRRELGRRGGVVLLSSYAAYLWFALMG